MKQVPHNYESIILGSIAVYNGPQKAKGVITGATETHVFVGALAITYKQLFDNYSDTVPASGNFGRFVKDE